MFTLLKFNSQWINVPANELFNLTFVPAVYSTLASFAMQKVLYFNNLFYINDLYMYMCLLRDKLGTKIGVKNAKKNKYRH